MTEKELELLVGVSVDVEQIKQRLDVIEQHLTKTPRLRHDLLGRQVISVGGSATRCVGCPQETDSCLKVELVGGDYLCLAKQPAVTGLDDSPKSLEDVYRENMELMRRYSIEQSEANQRLVEALKEASEELKKPVISFDEEDDNKGLLDIMAEIKEKADNFMDYLDKVVINPQEQ